MIPQKRLLQRIQSIFAEELKCYTSFAKCKELTVLTARSLIRRKTYVKNRFYNFSPSLQCVGLGLGLRSWTFCSLRITERRLIITERGLDLGVHLNTNFSYKLNQNDFSLKCCKHYSYSMVTLKEYSKTSYNNSQVVLCIGFTNRNRC